MNAFDRKIPYNNLPLLPPKEDIETAGVLRKTIAASRALAQLNGALLNLPNPHLFLDTIHLQEAKASSEIEHIITTNDDLYQSVVAEKKFGNPATKEVISYKEALWHGLQRLQQRPFISTNLCIEIVQKITQNTAGIRVTPGTTLSNTRGEVIYTPPEGVTIIRDKLANLEQFINLNESLDPLVKMVVMHYQFEAIHPFSDGNGRTGRILLLLYLKLSGLLNIPAIFLSEYIIKHKTDYYGNLRRVTENRDWEPFLIYMLDMVENTAIDGLTRLEKILKLMEWTSGQMKADFPKMYSKELIENLFKLPYTKRKHLVDAGFGTPKTVGKYLTELEKKNYLKSVRVGKEKLYLNYRLMNILESK